MTTSSSSGVGAWFSPTRILLVLPIVLGIGVGTLLVMLGVLPIVVQLQQDREEVELMEIKKIGLPVLRDQLNTLHRDLEDKQEQQNRLVSVVAGSHQLRTFLATLNELTALMGVQIQSIETKPVVRYVAPLSPLQSDEGQTAVESTPPLPTDPLLLPGLERRSVVISMKGPFPALLNFLRELEALEVITIIDELTLLNSSQEEEPTQLTMAVSAYGRS